MPILGLGTFKITTGEDVYQTILDALEIGYRHIDTAFMYDNEKGIGRAIKDSNIKRKSIFLTTKINCRVMNDPKLLEKHFNESLEDLQTDYVDLVLIHWPSHNPDVNQRCWEFLEKMYALGKARSIGVSNFQVHHLDKLLKTAKIIPMINQVELHPGLTQEPLQKYLENKKIAIQSYGPLMKGQVFAAPFIEELTKLAEKNNCTIAQLIVAWGIKRNIIMIPKSVNYKRLEENFNAINIKLSNKTVEEINKLNKGWRVYTDPDNNPIAAK